MGNFSSTFSNIWANGTKMAPFDHEVLFIPLIIFLFEIKESHFIFSNPFYMLVVFLDPERGCGGNFGNVP
jgi:hypothetical protein